MRLVASMITRNELGRYLRPSIAHLREFCDEIRVLDDASDDGTCEWLCEQRGVALAVNEGPSMFEHEGRARQKLLEWTLAAAPDYVLAIDADEFVTDGAALRRSAEAGGEALTLVMREVWKAGESLWTREDGGWRAHPVPILWRVPPGNPKRLRILDRALACGREPEAVRAAARRGMRPSGADVLHFGWAREEEREARYRRYAEADGGRFHASAHLNSILWPEERVKLEARPWPEGLRERLGA